MSAVVTGLGLVCALGTDAAAVYQALRQGASGLSAAPGLARMPGGPLAGRVVQLDLGRWLQRRKDRKLMARPSELALPAFGEALGAWPGDRVELGLFCGVGREPPDDGDSEAALVAAADGRRLSDALLAGPGRDRYPPLLPLQTLPNMALAHVSINLGICGENGAWAGGPAAALRAVIAAIQAVEEGRAPAALAGASDSQVDRGSQRDRLRLGAADPPGEAAAAVLIEEEAAAIARGAPILARISVLPSAALKAVAAPAHRAALGDCGAADGALALVLAIAAMLAEDGPQEIVFADPGLPPTGLALRPA